MATILRVKRKRNEDPVENIVVSCKKIKSEVHDSRNHEEKDIQSSLKFAGTVTSKEEVISKHIRDAIRKDKLQKEYKRHQPGGLQRSRQHKRESSKANRFNITSTFRALDLAALDKEKEDGRENKKSLNSHGDVCELCMKECEKSIQNKNSSQPTEKNEKEPVMCNCEKKKSVKCVREESSSGLNFAVNGAQATEKVYHLYDIEVTRSNLPTFESLMQEAQNASFVTCNSVQMVHEQVPEEDREEDYVYDLYYTNSRDFNLQLLESSLMINSINMDSHVNGHNGEEDHEVYEDEDDENEEDNWRNDYPEEDPRFFENGDVDYVYGNGFDDYQSFDYDDRGLVEWMSSRCNIEDESDESSSEDTEEASFTGYEQYKHRVIKELKLDHS